MGTVRISRIVWFVLLTLLAAAACSGAEHDPADRTSPTSSTEAPGAEFNTPLAEIAANVDRSLHRITPRVLRRWANRGNTWSIGMVPDGWNPEGRAVPPDTNFDAPYVTGATGSFGPTLEGDAYATVFTHSDREARVLLNVPSLGFLELSDPRRAERGRLEYLAVLDGVAVVPGQDGGSEVAVVATTMPQRGEAFTTAVRIDRNLVADTFDNDVIAGEPIYLDLDQTELAERLAASVGRPIVLRIEFGGFTRPQWDAYRRVLDRFLTPKAATLDSVGSVSAAEAPSSGTAGDVNASLIANADAIDEVVSTEMAPAIDAAQEQGLVIGVRARRVQRLVEAMLRHPSSLPLAGINFTDLAAPL